MRTLIPKPKAAVPALAAPARPTRHLPRVNVERSADAPHAHDFSQLPLHAPTPSRASALTIGATDDPHEAQADRFAGQVMRAPDSAARVGVASVLPPAASSLPPSIVRPWRGPSVAAAAMAAPPPIQAVLAGDGQPLDATARQFMEPRFQSDFSGIRVHADAQAHRSADQLQARAYAVGEHIVFGAGQYDARSTTGRTLLAHELAHTLQGSAAGTVLRRQPRDEHQKATATPRQVERIEPRRDMNKVQVIFLDFMFQRDVLPLIFKDGKLPPGFSVDGSGDMAVTTRWEVTGPVDRDLVDKASPLTAQVTSMIVAARAPGQANERKQSAIMSNSSVQAARERFHQRHDGHSSAVLENIDDALAKATDNNPDLLIAYYDYYANNKLTDELESARAAGSTSNGDTDINPRILTRNSNFPTDNAGSLLGETLLHEYVHTPQGGKGTIVEQAPMEAKAYGVELFFAERMHDAARARVIDSRYDNNSIDLKTGSMTIYRVSHDVMGALYEIIDAGRSQAGTTIAGDISSEDARRMSVEFISKNEADYGKALKAFVAKIRKQVGS